MFSLPKVSAKTKFKLTAHEGCRVRKVALVIFSSTAQEDYSEHTLVCLTNMGDMHLYNIPGLRPQVSLVGVFLKTIVLLCLFIDVLFVSSGSIRLHSQRGHQWNCVLCFHQEWRG